MTPEQIARYFHKLKILIEVEKPRAIILGDETGYSCFYGAGLKGVKCISQAQYRNEVYRTTSELRDHITVLPFTALILDDQSEIKEIHHLPPLFIFARKYVGTKLADSTLDPANHLPNNCTMSSKWGSKQFARNHQSTVPAPTHFERFVAASESGNANSVIMFNFFKQRVIAWLRRLGVHKEDKSVLLWDRHASHEGPNLLTFLEDENILSVFGPTKGTNWWHFHDAEHGPFRVLKSVSRKDIASWNAHLSRQNKSLALEDFPFVLQNAYQKSIEEHVTKRALKNVGLFPFNPDKVLNRMPESNTFAEYQSEFKTGQAVCDQEQEVRGKEVDSRGQSEDEDDMFFQTASQPLPYRQSPKRRPGPRLQRDPFSVTFTTRPDPYDFEAQERLFQIRGLVSDSKVVQSAVKKPRSSLGRWVVYFWPAKSLLDVTCRPKKSLTNLGSREQQRPRRTIWQNRRRFWLRRCELS